MIAERPYIIYTLPKSRTTQALTGRKIEKVWANIQQFLVACTSADLKNPSSIYLTAFTADEEHGEEPFGAEQLLIKTRDVFGPGITQPVSYSYPANTPSKQTQTGWQVSPGDLDKAIEFIVNLQPMPKYNLGPIELIISYNFKLIDTTTKTELDNQQSISSLLIWLSRSNCISPTLCFPFSQPDKDFWNYVESIEASMPFKLDRKYLRLVKANRKGSANMFSKI